MYSAAKDYRSSAVKHRVRPLLMCRGERNGLGSHMLHAKFKDEAEFREQFVKPLLSRMGFFGVAHIHGSREFGKDFVFSEVTKFGLIRHCAAQVKHEDRIQQTQRAKISELLEQIRQAFAVPFRLPDSPRERFVSAVYVFNSGEITQGAKDHLLHELTRERFGDNVHVFDGDRLETINRLTSYHREESIRPMLLGLRTQLLLNILIWQSILDALPAFTEARGTMLASVEAYLSAPVFTEYVPIQDVGQVWQKARIIDTINHRYLMGVNTKPEIKTGDIATVKQLCGEVIQHALAVVVGIDKCSEVYKPL